MFLKSFELSIFWVSLLASYVSKSSLTYVYMSSCIPQKQLITYHWALLSMSSKSGISISYSPSSLVKLCPAAGVIRTAFGWANHISWHIESCNILLREGSKQSQNPKLIVTIIGPWNILGISGISIESKYKFSVKN